MSTTYYACVPYGSLSATEWSRLQHWPSKTKRVICIWEILLIQDKVHNWYTTQLDNKIMNTNWILNVALQSDTFSCGCYLTAKQTLQASNCLHSLTLTLTQTGQNIQIFQRQISLSSPNICPLSLWQKVCNVTLLDIRNELRLEIKSFAYYMNLLCVYLVQINFIDSMSLCGLLVVLLGLLVYVVPSPGTVSFDVVLRLCLKSVCLILINFLFLM